MNALVAFRANFTGNLSVKRAERLAAQKTIAAESTASVAAQKAAEKAVSTAKTTEAIASTPDNELDRDAFLQLLVLEMQNQDPLDPVDNSDMIAQLAQFSSLEQMERLNDSFEGVSTSLGNLAGNMDQLNFITAQGMLGQYVEGVDASGAAVTGTVSSVHLDGSIVVLNVDGTLLPMTNVLTVGTEPTDA